MPRPRTRTTTITRDAGFAHRLRKAIEGVETIPEFGQGQQTWLRDRLGVSAEAVRKWLSGEARPRPTMMKRIAELLDADEAWLSLGIAPDVEPKERRARKATAEGAVNILVGLSQLNGCAVAFPQLGDPRAAYVDFYVIDRGIQYAVHVSLAQETDDGKYRFTLPTEHPDCHVIGAIQRAPMRVDYIVLKPEQVAKHASRRGGFYTLHVERTNSEYATNGEKWPRSRPRMQ